MPLFKLVDTSSFLQHAIDLHLVHQGNLINLALLDNVVRVVVGQSQTLQKILELRFRKDSVIYLKLLGVFVLPNTLNAEYAFFSTTAAGLISVVGLDGNGVLHVVNGTLNQCKATCK